MKVYNAKSDRFSEEVDRYDDDYDVGIFLLKEEAEELRHILSSGVPYKGFVKDAPFKDKLDLGLEMIGIKRKRRKKDGKVQAL